MARRASPRTPKPRVSPEDEAMFLAATEGATPLAQRDRVRLDPPKSGVVARPDPLPPQVALTLEADDGQVSGRAGGVNRAQLALLRAGKVRPEATLDLHGHTAATGGPALEQFLVTSARARRRCVLVIHGQGHHAGGVAVLRDLVIADLVGKASGLVHAFTAAAPADGGRGATYVMLRSSR